MLGRLENLNLCRGTSRELRTTRISWSQEVYGRAGFIGGQIVTLLCTSWTRHMFPATYDEHGFEARVHMAAKIDRVERKEGMQKVQ